MDRHNLFWTLWLIPVFIVASYISWQMLCSQKFLYSLFYDHGELEIFIEKYAPQNRLKPEFANTDREQRIKLFGRIVDIVNGGQGSFENLVFESAQGELIQLLHKAEIEHLELVKALVSRFKLLCLFSAFLVFLSLFFIRNFRPGFPYFPGILLTYCGFFASSLAVIFILGPMEVFDQLHHWAFPAGHQWFFYYQDSLMTTMMMAPDMFAYFAIIWFASCVFVFTVLLWVFFSVYKQYLKRFAGEA